MTIGRAAKTAVAAVLALSIASFATHASDDFLGTWKVKDSRGRRFDIAILADGKATSTLHLNQAGSWQEEGSAVVITWSTGWTSKIQKIGAHYTHTAYGPGQSLNGSPNNTSDAEKER